MWISKNLLKAVFWGESSPHNDSRIQVIKSENWSWMSPFKQQALQLKACCAKIIDKRHFQKNDAVLMIIGSCPRRKGKMGSALPVYWRLSFFFYCRYTAVSGYEADTRCCTANGLVCGYSGSCLSEFQLHQVKAHKSTQIHTLSASCCSQVCNKSICIWSSFMLHW